MESAKKKKSNYHMIWQFYIGFVSQVYEITFLSTLARPHSWQQYSYYMDSAPSQWISEYNRILLGHIGHNETVIFYQCDWIWRPLH